MVDDSTFEDMPLVRSFSSFPARPLTEAEWHTLEASDRLNAGPTAGYPDTGKVTHLQLSIADTFYHIGYNPETEEWEQIAKLPLGDTDTDYVNAEFIEVIDDDTGEQILVFEEPSNEEDFISAIARYVSDYIEHTYDNHDRPPAIFIEEAARLADQQ